MKPLDIMELPHTIYQGVSYVQTYYVEQEHDNRYRRLLYLRTYRDVPKGE